MRPFVPAILLLFVATATPADVEEYLARPEPASGWKKIGENREGGLVHLRIELVSQEWRGGPWRHELELFRAERVSHPHVALLFVTAGRGWFGSHDRERRLAAATGATIAVLGEVPNQPLFGRTEDDLIAYTFEEFLRSGDPEWPLLLPMTKSVVKAMDAIQEIARVEWSRPIERFVVTGASKRGWTSWLTAAFDPRVAGVAPLVFDNLNFAPQLENQLAAWGHYSEQLGDYTGRGLPAMIRTERGGELVAEVDPFSHRERLRRVPKLIVNGTNDRYWELRALSLYWGELDGEKAVLYVPNAGHEAGGDERASRATSAFVRRAAANRPLPVFEAEPLRDDASVGLRMKWSEPPVAGRLWYASSPTRDFRSARWRSAAARREGESLAATVETSRDRFVALFGEAEFREGELLFPLSTTIHLVEPRR